MWKKHGVWEWAMNAYGFFLGSSGEEGKTYIPQAGCGADLEAGIWSFVIDEPKPDATCYY